MYADTFAPYLPLHREILRQNAEIRGLLALHAGTEPELEAPLPEPDWEEPFELTSEHLRVLAADGDPRGLAAAALRKEEPDGLLEAARQAPEDPVVACALAWGRFSWGRHAQVDSADVLRSLRRQEPDNGLADFLDALRALAKGDPAGAVSALNRASTAPRLDLGTDTLRRTLIATAERLGASPSQARALAMGLPYAGVVCLPLIQALPDLPAAHEAALVLGERLAEGRLEVDVLLGIRIQEICLQVLPPEERERRRVALGTRREVSRQAIARLDRLRHQAIPTERWVAYVDEMFATSEIQAIRSLDAERRAG